MSAIHSKETIASIAEYAASGMSASQIAAKFENMTRNSVVGIAFRNKFKLDGRHSGGSKPGQAMAKPTYMQCEPIVEEIPADLISFEELGPPNCKWPFGDADYKFCGKKRWGELPYCASHCRVAYAPRG